MDKGIAMIRTIIANKTNTIEYKNIDFTKHIIGYWDTYLKKAMKLKDICELNEQWTLGETILVFDSQEEFNNWANKT